MKDYYKILGINRSASTEDVKRAYRQLAHQYHPDRPGGDEGKFKEINEAYQILSNQDKRRQYDQFGQAFDGAGGSNPFGFGGQGGSWEFGFEGLNVEDLGNFGEVFESFFEGLGVKRRKTYHRGADLELQLEITLEESFSGVDKNLGLKSFIACADCAGAGHFADSGFVECVACGGRGEVRETRNGFFGQFSQIRPCVKCFGQGQIPNKICQNCSGSGRRQQKKEVVVQIAPGVRHGQILKVASAGEAGERGAAAGDLYLRITLKPHPFFKVEENNLFIEKELDLMDVISGKKIMIQNISGKKNEIEIPPQTNLTDLFKIIGEGMPVFGNSGRRAKRGDLYVKFNIRTPKP